MRANRKDLLTDKATIAQELLWHVVNDDNGDTILETLRQLERTEQTVQSAIGTAVEEARATGATWQQIADALCLNSRQAAESRYGR